MKANNYHNIFNSIFTLVFKNKLLLLASTAMIISSCQEPLEVDYELTGESVLNVEGKITTDTTSHYVILSRTIPMDQNDQTWETGATVTIANNNNVITLTETTPGHYYTEPDVYGLIGQKYDLNIVLSNGEVYTASTFINNISEIDSVKFLYEEFENYDIYFHNLYFHGWELEEEGNAYLWDLYINDTLYNDTMWKTTFVDDELVNGNYIGTKPGTNTSDFAVYSLQPHEITSDTCKVLLVMESIPHDYYDFWITLMQQTEWTGSPFDANKADPLSNISGGAMGFFYGASVKRASFVYIRPEESKNVDQPVLDF